MKAAFERLGFDPCYHFIEVMELRAGHNEGHRKAWVDFQKGRREMDWHWLFQRYDAVLDLPMCLYYEEMMEAFPEARVVLTLRDPDRWFDSFSSMSRSLRRMRLATLFSPKLRATITIANTVNDRLFGGPPLDRDVCIRAFEEHNRRVIEAVPSERLLVYEVGQGWEPLCTFLDLPVPDVDFPHLNEGEGLTSRMVQAHILQKKDAFSTDHLKDTS